MIRLAAGDFMFLTEWNFNSTSGHAIDLEGGYDNACIVQTLTPELTLLDASLNARDVISLQSNGDITMRRLTIENGQKNGAGAGLQVDLTDANTTLLFESNQVVSNTSAAAVGGMSIIGSGNVELRGNLFASNIASATSALGIFTNGASVYVTNNTFAGNTITGTGGSFTVLLEGAPTSAFVSNNISYGNVADDDFYLSAFELWEFHNNDYHVIVGTPATTSSGNVDVDPQFVDGAFGDFHLMDTSTLLNAGTTAAAGGFPYEDLDGNPRTFAGKIDMGAINTATASSSTDSIADSTTIGSPLRWRGYLRPLSVGFDVLAIKEHNTRPP